MIMASEQDTGRREGDRERDRFDRIDWDEHAGGGIGLSASTVGLLASALPDEAAVVGRPPRDAARTRAPADGAGREPAPAAGVFVPIGSVGSVPLAVPLAPSRVPFARHEHLSP